MMLTKDIAKMKQITAEHIAADQVTAWHYWDGNEGCLIGCLTHSDNAQGVTDKFGIPLALVRICDYLFIRLGREKKSDGIEFFRDIPNSIDVDGKDLSRVHWLFLRDVLENLPQQKKAAQDVINQVLDGLSLLAQGGDWPQVIDVSTDAAAAAFTAFDDAAAALKVAVPYIAVAYVARAAAGAADEAAYSRLRAVYAAAGAADDAAGASLDCAYAAVLFNHEVQGHRNETRRQAEALLRLLKEAPVKEEKNDD